VTALPDYDLITPGSGPIVLMGKPSRLRGEVALRNPGDRMVPVTGAVIRDLPVHLQTAPSVTGDVAVDMLAVLPPGHSETAKVRVQLASTTPPGRYEANLALGTRSYPAVLLVTEHIDLEISPNPIVVENRPGSRTTKAVVIRNKGNVPLSVTDPGAVMLDDELLQCKSIRGGFAEGAESAKNLEEWAMAFLRQGKKNLDRAGMLWVENVEGDVIIEPGEVRTVEFMIRQPDTHSPSGRYTALAFLYTANLNFAIVPSGAGRPEGSSAVKSKRQAPRAEGPRKTTRSSK
jgi:hypothetical protein